MTLPPFSPYTVHVFCCTNVRPPEHPKGSCGAKGSEALLEYLKHKVKSAALPGVKVTRAGCMSLCRRGPVMVIYPQGVWYAYRSEQDIDAIFEQHLTHGQVVQHLLLSEAQKEQPE